MDYDSWRLDNAIDEYYRGHKNFGYCKECGMEFSSEEDIYYNDNDDMLCEDCIENEEE